MIREDNPNEAEQIMGTAFYLYKEDGVMWIGIVLPGGIIAFPFDSSDWVDWLRGQLEKCHIANLPQSILKEFSQHV